MFCSKGKQILGFRVKQVANSRTATCYYNENACLFFLLQIFFAIIPPVHFCGGWLTFFVALIFMIIMTVIVGDLASIFGCLCGLEKPITAITIVALGKENQTSDNLVDVMMGC